MRGQLLRYLSALILGSLLTTFIHYAVNNDWKLLNTQPQQHHVKNTITGSYKEIKEKSKGIEICSEDSQVWKNENQKIDKKPPQLNDSQSCQDCRKKIEEMLQKYTQPWVKDEEKFQEIRTGLRVNCNGLENAIITQKNSPMRTKIVYDGDKGHTLKVNSQHFATFVKTRQILNKTLQSCAVVGNGGILANSYCGNNIDSAEFVIRCNLAPLLNGYEEHVGVKTNIVTANPSILSKRYGSLLGSRRRFVESLCQYDDAMVLLPAFSYVVNTALSFRALYTIDDFEMPIRSAFMNPNYLRSLAVFWRSHGLLEKRHSTGLMMVSLALELCDNVDLFGFWPFGLHPESFQELTHHYYDNNEAKKSVHVMSDEFKFLLQLHNQGVLNLHLGECVPEE
ncbi:alpha-N-acetylneuraminide alpha-2,8-sialyltransferase-like [Xiphophorus hellerii]|uniref:alpha-N-acetylneuraminide alpha-2,8-sialyltransferase-like n=1 Tax=Xiphophorus hellerii TaxID=8084 RepID=UPI0013B428E7|nr:alpha-N-acetylneuraminide alpha-2,8-sialyltransferase-like [Xiphophorus hellerii]